MWKIPISPGQISIFMGRFLDFLKISWFQSFQTQCFNWFPHWFMVNIHISMVSSGRISQIGRPSRARHIARRRLRQRRARRSMVDGKRLDFDHQKWYNHIRHIGISWDISRICWWDSIYIYIHIYIWMYVHIYISWNLKIDYIYTYWRMIIDPVL